MRQSNKLSRYSSYKTITVIAVATAVATAITLISVGAGLQQSITENLRDAGADIYVQSQASSFQTNAFGVEPMIDNSVALFEMFDNMTGVDDVLPLIKDKTVYMRRNGDVIKVRATALLPDVASDMGKQFELIDGTHLAGKAEVWRSIGLDALVKKLDSFHIDSYNDLTRRDFREWHYFNFIDDRTGVVGVMNFSIDGSRSEQIGGVYVLQFKVPERKEPFIVVSYFSRGDVEVSSDSPDIRLGQSTVKQVQGGLKISTKDSSGKEILRLKYEALTPPLVTTRRYGISGGNSIGHVLPMIKASVSGWVEIDGKIYELKNVRGYHDHNWGNWSWNEVNWIWGQAVESKWVGGFDQPGRYSLMFARLVPSSVSEKKSKTIKGEVILFNNGVREPQLQFDGYSYHTHSWGEGDDYKVKPLVASVKAKSSTGYLNIHFYEVSRLMFVVPYALDASINEIIGVYYIDGVVNGNKINFVTTGFWEDVKGSKKER